MRMAVLGRLGPSELKSSLRRASLASFGASPLMRVVVFVSCWAAVTVTIAVLIGAAWPFNAIVVPDAWWEIPGVRPVFTSLIVALYLFVAVWMPFWAAMQLGRSALIKRISRWIREGACVVCGYDLGGINDCERCPECGAPDLRHAGRLDDEAFAASMLGGNGQGRSGEQGG